jgi:branched-chain amino acid transport system substrate-binding protein
MSIRKSLMPFLGIVSLFVIAGCADSGFTPSSGTQESQNLITTSQEVSKEVMTVKLGSILPMSGDASAYGVEMKRALDYRIAEMNAAAEKNGYKVELIVEDGKCNGADAVTAFQKLTDVDGVKFIIGGGCSSESLGIAPLLSDKKVLALSAFSSNPEVEGKSPYLFSLSYSDKLVGEGLTSELAKYKKVALISEQQDYTQGIKKIVEATLKDKYPDVEVVANEEFAKGSTDFRTLLDKVKSSGAEAVLLNPNVGVTAETLLKQIAEIKDWKVQFVTQFAYLNDKILSIAPETAEGMTIVDVPSVSDPKFVDYKAKIVVANGTLDNLGSFYTATALDALDILTKLYVDTKGDSEIARDTLSSQSFTGWSNSTLTFGGKSFVQGVNVALYNVKGGKSELQK